MITKKFIFIALIAHVVVLSATFKARCIPFSSTIKGAMKSKVYDLIDTSQKSLLVSMFTFTDNEAARKLALAKARGVKVQVIMDQSSSGTKYLIKNILEQCNVPTYIFKKSNAINHNKYMIVDGKKVWVSSMNWTDAAYHRNCETGVLLYSRAIASYYAIDFMQTATDIKRLKLYEIDERKKISKALAYERKKHQKALAELKDFKKKK